MDGQNQGLHLTTNQHMGTTLQLVGEASRQNNKAVGGLVLTKSVIARGFARDLSRVIAPQGH